MDLTVFRDILCPAVKLLKWKNICIITDSIFPKQGVCIYTFDNFQLGNYDAYLWVPFCNPFHRLSLCEQNDIFEWARDHRVHHKYSETDADPHNATRGFFFAHIGWLLVRKHPDVIEKGKKLDMSDLKADKVVMFQRR